MKQRRKTVVVFFMLLVFVFAVAAAAKVHGRKEGKKVGILLVAFGSSMPQAQVSFDNIEKKVKAAFPDYPVQWAYTSSMIRKKLAKQGKMLDSPELALARMLDEGYTHVAVQSLHTIFGYEFHDLTETAGAFRFRGGFKKILVGYPLLATQEDMAGTVDAVLETVPKMRGKNEAVVLMGHGSHHPSNAFYAALMFQLQRKDPLVFVGCVEGYPDIGEIRAMLKEKNIQKTYLMPLMSVAGNHARKDMAGEEDDSWRSILTKDGIECVPILKGTAEYDPFVSIWVDHLGDVLKQLK